MAFEKEAKVPRKKGSYAPDEGVGEMGGGGGLTSHSVVVRIGRKAC